MNQQIVITMTSAKTFALGENRKFEDLNPKELLLLAGATCAGMTAMSILDKQRIKVSRLEIDLSGRLSTATLQSDSVFDSFHIVYNVACDCAESQEKVARAIDLAHEKYCGGVKMLGKIAPIDKETAIVNTGA